VTAYDDTGIPVATDAVDTVFVRIGDGELGTSEDLIEDTGAPAIVDYYPTGLAWSGVLQSSNLAVYDLNFDPFDYTSDFEVQSFDFNKLNADSILELTFDAQLKIDDLGAPVWETYILNADITP